jgi:hypothetical protein
VCINEEAVADQYLDDCWSHYRMHLLASVPPA